MKKATVKIIASAEVELDDNYDVYDIDGYVKDNYYNSMYPGSEFRLVGYEVDITSEYKNRINELEIENCKLRERLGL